ncbi:50S ribosomal protein L13 [Candidatus Woesearchaeota archaeon]|nr:MAG: 50S ribosomal protein L13 [Candidatus Woesearchaeota archaeon]
MVTIDATGLIAGRLASYAAKQALLGKTVMIINAEKAVISGDVRRTINEAKYKKFVRGVPRKGPYYSKMPDRYLRRIIRGMLPKTVRGRTAFGRIKCFIGTPAEIGGEAITLPEANASKLPNLQRITIGKLCTELGGKHYG